MYGLARIYARLDQPQITDTQGRESIDDKQTHERDGQRACHCRCHMDRQCMCGRCHLVWSLSRCVLPVDNGGEKLLCEEEKICPYPHRCAD
jgi:hypothetical protein